VVLVVLILLVLLLGAGCRGAALGVYYIHFALLLVGISKQPEQITGYKITLKTRFDKTTCLLLARLSKVLLEIGNNCCSTTSTTTS